MSVCMWNWAGFCNAFSTSNSYISSAQCQCESLKSTHSNFTGAFSTSATVFFYCVTLGMWRVAVGNKSFSTTHCKLQNYISNKDKVKVLGRLYLCARLFVLIRVQIESEWKYGNFHLSLSPFILGNIYFILYIKVDFLVRKFHDIPTSICSSTHNVFYITTQLQPRYLCGSRSCVRVSAIRILQRFNTPESRA